MKIPGIIVAGEGRSGIRQRVAELVGVDDARAGADEAQDRLRDHRRGADIGGLHHDRRHRIRQDMPQHQPRYPRARGNGALDVVLFPDGKDHCAGEADDAVALHGGLVGQIPLEEVNRWAARVLPAGRCRTAAVVPKAFVGILQAPR